MFHILHRLALSYSAPSSNSGGIFSGALLTAVLLISATVLVLTIVGTWKAYQKADKPGWASIIPFYSTWVMAEIGGKSGWFGLAAIFVNIIPLLGGIASIIMYLVMSLAIAKNFGKNGAFGFFLLFLLAPIGWLILGFGKSRYSPNSNVPETPGNAPAAGEPAPQPFTSPVTTAPPQSSQSPETLSDPATMNPAEPSDDNNTTTPTIS